MFNNPISKNYRVLSSTSADVRSICKPLLKHTDITYFCFSRYYSNKRRFHLTTHPCFWDTYYTDSLYNFSKSEKLAETKTDNSFLWDYWDLTNKSISYKKVGLLIRNKFQLDHGFEIVRPQKQYRDVYTFCSHPSSFAINDFYIHHFDLLETFIKYFQEKAGRLINSSSTKAFKILPNNLYTNNIKNDLLDGCLTHKVMQQSSNEDLQLFHKLTPREKECLCWLFYGKTAAEIAIILDISQRTAEKHIISVKKKLSCYTLFQLGCKFSKIKSRLLLMESIKCNNEG
jgi:hypothetical protein